MKACVAFPGTRTNREIKNLYHAAFPPKERYPYLRMLMLGQLCPDVQLRGYWEEQVFLGFTMTVCAKEYLYINFIAVDPRQRSGGTGSRILRQLQEDFPHKHMLVEVLSPEEGDRGTALLRMEFYRQNGFYDLDRTVKGMAGEYRIFSTRQEYDPEAYWEIFGHMSLKPAFLKRGRDWKH